MKGGGRIAGLRRPDGTAQGTRAKGNGCHCPYVLKAEKIRFENRKLYVVFEKMDMSLTQWIKKKGNRAKVKLNEDTEIRVIMK